jgi:type II secretory pathway predicted ATPase ExeA
MYQKHFGLKRLPFASLALDDCYFPAAGHEAALAQLIEGVHNQEGLLFLTGAPGTGKTRCAYRLLEQLPSAVTPAFLTGAAFADPSSLLQAVLYDLGRPYESRPEEDLRLALTDCLLEHFAENRRVLLLLDEAHHLDARLLEGLRLLTNLEGKEGRAVQVLFAGQPSILDALDDPMLACFKTRLSVQAELTAFTPQETVNYLLARLESAGGLARAIVTLEALELIAESSAGIPRRANQIAHRSLTVAAAADLKPVDVEAVVEALGRSAPPLSALAAASTAPETATPADALLGSSIGRGGRRPRRLFAAPKSA